MEDKGNIFEILVRSIGAFLYSKENDREFGSSELPRIVEAMEEAERVASEEGLFENNTTGR